MRVALVAAVLVGVLASEGRAVAQESPAPGAESVPPEDSGWFPEPSRAPAAQPTEGDSAKRTNDPQPPPAQPLTTAQPAPLRPDRAPPVAALPPAVSRRWYGWQIILTDASAVTLTVAGALGEADGLVTLGVLSYLFGPPIVHFAHRNVGRGFGSLGLRLGAPFVGALLGVAVANCSEGSDFCGMPEVAVAMTAATLTAVVVDAAVLAYDVEKKPRRTWTPSLRLGRHGGVLVLDGQF